MNGFYEQFDIFYGPYCVEDQTKALGVLTFLEITTGFYKRTLSAFMKNRLNIRCEYSLASYL